MLPSVVVDVPEACIVTVTHSADYCTIFSFLNDLIAIILTQTGQFCAVGQTSLSKVVNVFRLIFTNFI
jgi:hypothetical protein